MMINHIIKAADSRLSAAYVLWVLSCPSGAERRNARNRPLEKHVVQPENDVPAQDERECQPQAHREELLSQRVQPEHKQKRAVYRENRRVEKKQLGGNAPGLRLPVELRLYDRVISQREEDGRRLLVKTIGLETVKR